MLRLDVDGIEAGHLRGVEIGVDHGEEWNGHRTLPYSRLDSTGMVTGCLAIPEVEVDDDHTQPGHHQDGDDLVHPQAGGCPGGAGWG